MRKRERIRKENEKKRKEERRGKKRKEEGRRGKKREEETDSLTVSFLVFCRARERNIMY